MACTLATAPSPAEIGDPSGRDRRASLTLTNATAVAAVAGGNDQPCSDAMSMTKR